MKSIGHTQKAFVVETNDKEGYIYIDDVKKIIPANSTKAFSFNNKFGSITQSNPGIAYFLFLVTDTSEIKNMRYMFSNCSSLTSLLLGPNFFKTSVVTRVSFASCSKWANETVITSLVTNSYDRAAAGLNTLTLQLHSNTKAVLTDEQKAAITSKGYTIA